MQHVSIFIISSSGIKNICKSLPKANTQTKNRLKYKGNVKAYLKLTHKQKIDWNIKVNVINCLKLLNSRCRKK